MSSSKVLADRGVAETKHGNMIRKLESVVSQDGPNRRTIQNSLNQLKEAWDGLMEKHVLYVMRVNQSLDNEVHQNWVNTKSDLNHP